MASWFVHDESGAGDELANLVCGVQVNSSAQPGAPPDAAIDGEEKFPEALRMQQIVKLRPQSSARFQDAVRLPQVMKSVLAVEVYQYDLEENSVEFPGREQGQIGFCMGVKEDIFDIGVISKKKGFKKQRKFNQASL